MYSDGVGTVRPQRREDHNDLHPCLEPRAIGRAQIEALTNHNESSFSEPWAVSDAPHEFTEKLMGNIVGFEMVITRLSGKWKVSQNQPHQNQASVIEGLKAGGQQESSAMAVLVDTATKKSSQIQAREHTT